MKDRSVFVIRENDNYLEGLDLSYLSEDEIKDVKELLSKIEETEDGKIKNYKPEWNKAWRRFSKKSIVKDE